MTNGFYGGHLDNQIWTRTFTMPAWLLKFLDLKYSNNLKWNVSCFLLGVHIYVTLPQAYYIVFKPLKHNYS